MRKAVWAAAGLLVAAVFTLTAPVVTVGSRGCPCSGDSCACGEPCWVSISYYVTNRVFGSPTGAIVVGDSLYLTSPSGGWQC